MANSNINLKLASAGDDVKIWQSSNYHLDHQFSTHLAPSFQNVHWSSDFQQLVSVPSSGSTLLFTLVKSQSLQHLEIDTKVLNATARFSTTSTRTVGLGTKTGDVLIWDIKYHKPKKIFKCPTGEVTCLQFNWNDSYIASGSVDGSIILHNTTTGQSSSPLQVPNVQGIRDLRYSFTRKGLIGSASDDGTVALWDANVRQIYHNFPCSHNAPATGLAFSPANALLLTSVGLDKRVICYDTQSNRIVKYLVCESPLTSIDFKEDGITVAAGSSRGKIYFYDLRSPGIPMHTLSAHTSSVRCLAFQNTVVSSVLKKDSLKTTHSKVDSNNEMFGPGRFKMSSNENAKSNIGGEDSVVKQIHKIILPQPQAVRKNLASELCIKNSPKKSPGVPSVQLQGVQEVKRVSLTDEIFSPVKDLGTTDLDYRLDYKTTISPLVGEKPTFLPGLVAANSNSLGQGALHLSKEYNSSLGDLFSPVQDSKGNHSKSEGNETVRDEQNFASPPFHLRTATANSESNKLKLSNSHEPANNLDDCEIFPFESIGDASIFAFSQRREKAKMADETKVVKISKPSGDAMEIPQAMEVEALQDAFIAGSNSFEDCIPDLSNDNASDPTTDEGRGCSVPVTPMAPQAFQAEFIRQTVKDVMEEYHEKVHQKFLQYHAQMTFELVKLKAEISGLIGKKNSTNDQLVSEIERLREENRVLRATF